MPTMASYELKVTALIKDGTPEADAAAAAHHFENLCQTPTQAPAGSWPTEFFPWAKSTLAARTTIEDSVWEILDGSVVRAGSRIQAGSTWNSQTVQNTFDTQADTPITSSTLLRQGSILGAGTVLVNSKYSVMLWKSGREATPKWALNAGGGIHVVGSYELLTMQGVIGVIRPGALGQQWAMQSGVDDLQWFYQYRKTPWFERLITDLIKFNTQWAKILEEGARIRDLKWYCGNGSGP